MKTPLLPFILLLQCFCLSASASEDVFLLSYFKDNGERGVYLAYSEDGLTFADLNDGQPVFTPPDWGDQSLTRDPSIIYQDGVFRMVWTTSWTGTYFGAASSTDLKQWSKPIQVNPFTKWPGDDSPFNTWAPEVHWDPVQKNFLILWSSATLSLEGNGGHNSGGLENDETLNIKKDARHHRTFFSRTSDFQTFSDAAVFFNPGMSAIDANLAFDDNANDGPQDDRWIMAIKHEQYKELGGKNLKLAYAPADLTLTAQPGFQSLAEPSKVWTNPVVGVGSPIQPGHMVEGPTLIKVGFEWRLYFDRFDMQANRFGLATSNNLHDWTDRTADISVPAEARHGTVLVAPRSAVAFLK